MVSQLRSTGANLASIATITLNPQEHVSFFPLSHEGFVLISLGESTVQINGREDSLHLGDAKQLKGEEPLTLSNSLSSSAKFGLIKIKHSSQNLTITSTKLERGEELEDASDRNQTLLIAVTSLHLRDIRDMNDEDELSKPGKAAWLHLLKGQARWISPGMHRLRNFSEASVQFVTIEW